ncbi:hypothetical protein ACJX0J_033859, partial [Zea mays]
MSTENRFQFQRIFLYDLIPIMLLMTISLQRMIVMTPYPHATANDPHDGKRKLTRNVNIHA